MSSYPRYRVRIPFDRWTPVLNEVFDEIFAQLEENRSALVYLILYDRCRHRDGRKISATIAEIARWCGMDERPLTRCLKELERKKLIVRTRGGVKRSHINKPCWRVPLKADQDAEEIIFYIPGGHSVPHRFERDLPVARERH